MTMIAINEKSSDAQKLALVRRYVIIYSLSSENFIVTVITCHQ